MDDFYTDDPVAEADVYYAQFDARQAQKDEFMKAQIDYYWDELIDPSKCQKMLGEESVWDEHFPAMVEQIADMRRAIHCGHYDKDMSLMALGQRMIAFVEANLRAIAEDDWERKL